MPRTTKRFGSVEQAARECDISAKTIRRRIADGTVPAYRVGRLVKVDLDAAAAALLKPMNPAARRALGEGADVA